MGSRDDVRRPIPWVMRSVVPKVLARASFLQASFLRALFAATALFATAPFTSTARADETWLLSLEPSLALPLGTPQSDRFSPGLTGAISVQRSVHPTSLLGVRLRGGFLFDGPPPTEEGVVDPGIGTFNSLTLSYRLRPFANREDLRRGTGLFAEVAGGAMLTGSDVRATLEAAVGYGWELGIIDIGPSFRYVHVFQGKNNFDDRDASLLLLGLEVTFLDARPRVITPEERERIGDRDRDGLLDPDDACPDEPEDFDDFEDADGCPDPDNDQDTILDVNDSCPLSPEDLDGFEDRDGCPDPDNDRDGFLDVDDQCPNEAEVVNGVDDQDGCPDEGLIEMVDDRVVLDERVLFDFERARVKHAAQPVIAAIAELVRQHPEWDSMRIEGHADARGDAEYNRRLSERRARNVMRALVREGVTAARIDSVGYGADRLRDQGQTEEAHQRNRRVEFVVLRRVEAGSEPEEIVVEPPAVRASEEDDDTMVFDSDAQEPR